jgi:hypothetical protein
MPIDERNGLANRCFSLWLALVAVSLPLSRAPAGLLRLVMGP